MGNKITCVSAYVNKYIIQKYRRVYICYHIGQYIIGYFSPELAKKDKYSIEQPSVNIKRLRSVIIGPKKWGNTP